VLALIGAGCDDSTASKRIGMKPSSVQPAEYQAHSKRPLELSAELAAEYPIALEAAARRKSKNSMLVRRDVTFVQIDIGSVKNSAENTIKFLTSSLSKRTSNQG
jgi:hypothetical protein